MGRHLRSGDGAIPTFTAGGGAVPTFTARGGAVPTFTARGRGGTYFHRIGAARVLGAGGAIIDGVPRVTTGPVTGQLEK